MSNMHEFRGNSYRVGKLSHGGDSYRPGAQDRERGQDTRRADQYEFSFRAKDQIEVPRNDSYRPSSYRPGDLPDSHGSDGRQGSRPNRPSYAHNNSQGPGGGSTHSKAPKPVNTKEWEARRRQSEAAKVNNRSRVNKQKKFAPISAPTAPNDRLKNSAPNGIPSRPPPSGPRRYNYNPEPFASLIRQKTPELFVANPSKAGQNKFKTFESPSGDEDEEMDVETDTEDANQPPNKKVALERKVNEPRAHTEVPKWSNPDVYTALTGEQVLSSQKGLNLIKAIREARIEQEQVREANTVTENLDFLSLDLGHTGIKSKETNDARVTVDLTSGRPTKPKSQVKQIQTKNVLQDDEDVDSALGSRKRTADDQIKESKPAGRPPKAHSTLRGSVMPEWRPKNEETAAPWFKASNDPDSDPTKTLSQEILDFYNFVRPTDFENALRNDLISRTEEGLHQACQYARGARLLPFGSFAAGLYLPNGDMDLVLQGRRFSRTGIPDICQRKKELYGFHHQLVKSNIAEPGSVNLIAHAKVPIIKFRDSLTGLHIDLSFDSATGTDVVHLYHEWKHQYPVLPILASVIKQFLMMRSLNDVATGGLGGYSVICLVVSFLQHTPTSKHQEYGELLLGFLNFYGNEFDLRNNYINLNPPGYFPKVRSSFPCSD